MTSEAIINTNKSKSQLLWEQCAAKSMFFIGGFGAVTWAPLVPLLKDRLQLTEDILGLLILCVGIGSLLTMPISGAAATRWGCRRVLITAAAAYGIILLSIAQVASFWMAVPMILILGAAMGSIDVVVNVMGIIVEKESGKRIMSGMHAFWSVGGFVGSGIFSLWLTLGLNHLQSTMIAALIIAALIVIFGRHLLGYAAESEDSKLLALPRGIVIFIGLITFIAFLTEGAMMDWGGLFLMEEHNVDMSLAATGFMVFSAAMLLIRLTGDTIVTKLGDKAVAVGGSILALMGFLLLIFGFNAILLYTGFFLIGIGSANIVPIFFSLMGKQQDMPVNTAVPAVSTMGYLGILMGPAAIGFIATHTNLLFSFGFLSLLVFLQTLIARYVYKKLL